MEDILEWVLRERPKRIALQLNPINLKYGPQIVRNLHIIFESKGIRNCRIFISVEEDGAGCPNLKHAAHYAAGGLAFLKSFL